VADHRVQGVGHAVAEQPGDAEHRAPHERCDHRVGGVLRDRLDAGPADLAPVEDARVAADEVGESLSGAGQVVGGEEVVDGRRLPAE
jgi:hypothetical protein